MSFVSANLVLNVVGLVSESKNVAIYDGEREVLNGNFLFSSSVLSANISDDSQLCEHPLESGAVVSDHKIFNPIEIDIRLSLPSWQFSEIYRELLLLYSNSVKLRIKTKVEWYNNMVLTAIPHEEKAENFDKIVFDLHFKEVREITPQFIELEESNVKNPENSDTKKLGENATNNTKKSSMLVDFGNKIKGFF